jgi:hypothetical protein
MRSVPEVINNNFYDCPDSLIFERGQIRENKVDRRNRSAGSPGASTSAFSPPPAATRWSRHQSPPSHARARPLDCSDSSSPPDRPDPIGCVEPLRHDALKPHLARVLEYRRAVRLDVFVERQASTCSRKQLREPHLALPEWHRSKILVIELQQVERVQDGLAEPPAARSLH